MTPDERRELQSELYLTDEEMSYFFPGRKKQRQRDGVRIPRDVVSRERLFSEADLTPEERAAINQWCYDEEAKRARGVIFYEGEPRPVIGSPE